MACHYRVAVASAQVGLPEVKLGLIPGAGGAQRLPRLIGLARAAEMCATGEPVGAAEALQLGILDQIVDGDLLRGAIAFARTVADRQEPPRRTRDLPVRVDDPNALDVVRAAVQRSARGRQAPLKAIEAVAASTQLPFEEGWKHDRQLFTECLFSNESKSLIHVFLFTFHRRRLRRTANS